MKAPFSDIHLCFTRKKCLFEYSDSILFFNPTSKLGLKWSLKVAIEKFPEYEADRRFCRDSFAILDHRISGSQRKLQPYYEPNKAKFLDLMQLALV